MRVRALRARSYEPRACPTYLAGALSLPSLAPNRAVQLLLGVSWDEQPHARSHLVRTAARAALHALGRHLLRLEHRVHGRQLPERAEGIAERSRALLRRGIQKRVR